MYPRQFLTPIYMNLLGLFSGRGVQTISKLDSFLFNFPREVEIVADSSVSILLPPDPHYIGYLWKLHELHVSQAIANLAKSGDTVVDIGANVGYFSAYAVAAVGKQGKVFCLEPEPKNFTYLQQNCDRLQNNGFDCRAYKLAASNLAGRVNLRVHRLSTYHSIEDNAHELDRVEKIEGINTVRLDDWAESENISRISLLKIDTEGHEPRVLEGASRLYKARAIDYTILECRSEQIANYIDNFSQELKLYQLVWDGEKWCSCSAQSIENRTDCLLSLQPVSPDMLTRNAQIQL